MEHTFSRTLTMNVFITENSVLIWELLCLLRFYTCLLGQATAFVQFAEDRQFVQAGMKSKTNRSIQKARKTDNVQGGPNWVLVAGGVLLSTLSVKLGCKLKQLFDAKQRNSNTSKGLMPPFAVVTLIPCLYCFKC